MKIASWNVNSLKVRLPALQVWLEQAKPDIVGLQETKLEDANFPGAEIQQLGYHCVFSGQRTYNGVALLSREAPTAVVNELSVDFDPQRRTIAATIGGIRVVNLYVVNGQAVGSEKFAYKMAWLEAAHGFLQAELQRHENVVVMGDFNIAPEDRDVHDPDAWHERILCSSAERAALARICDLGFTDSFRQFENASGHYSWWDYRAGSFRRNLGLRIDLILVSRALLPRLRAAGIDREPRREERPSDHVPVWTQFDL